MGLTSPTQQPESKDGINHRLTLFWWSSWEFLENLSIYVVTSADKPSVYICHYINNFIEFVNIFFYRGRG